jgi:GMP synthase C terminal domain
MIAATAQHHGLTTLSRPPGILSHWASPFAILSGFYRPYEQCHPRGGAGMRCRLQILAGPTCIIIHEVKGANRVVYDITPGTIEWE